MDISFVFISPDEVRDGLVEINGMRHHHLARVRRLTVGDQLRAALPDGRVLAAEVVEITARTLRARVRDETGPLGLSPCRITLCQAILKGEKMELVVQKATELGAYALAPVLTRRSVPRWTPAQANDRVARWQRIAVAAAEQCERSLPMHILPVRSLADALTMQASLRMVLSERGGRSLRAIASEYPVAAEIILYLGPEGGWDEAEFDTFHDVRAHALHLGRRILRAETASLAALALVQYQWGDLAYASA